MGHFTYIQGPTCEKAGLPSTYIKIDPGHKVRLDNQAVGMISQN